MSNTPNTVALMSAALPDTAANAAPEWVHLLPAAQGEIQTGDQRGPYHVDNASELIAASFAESDKLPIDQDHAIDRAAPKGLPAPARGWIVEMQAREDGIWGKVEWTDAGAELVTSHAYRALSPVILHDKAKRLLSILRASLVNRPNLRGLAALHDEQEESSMEFMEKLAKGLGLKADAGESAILTAIGKLDDGAEQPALQSALSEIGVALGCEADAGTDDILTAAQGAAEGDTATITALQSELAEVTTTLNELSEDKARFAAESFVDGAIRDLRVGVKPQRDRFIAMHMRDSEEAEAVIGSLPKLGATATTLQPPAPKDGEVSLNDAHVEAARLLGIPADDYAKTLKAEETA